MWINVPRPVVMITNIGAIPKRVIDNINEIMPHRVAVFSQKNPKWNEENPEYKNILEKFFNDLLIQRYEEKKRLERIPVETCLLYDCVFKVLYEKACAYQKDWEVIIDVSGFTREATAAAQNIAACFDNVTIVYARGARGDEFDAKKYGPWINEHSGPLITVPVPRINVKALQDKDSQYFIVFKAVHTACQQGKRKCKNKDVAELLSKGKAPLTKNKKISVTMTLRTLMSYGLIGMEYIGGKTQEIELTPFGIGMANALFKDSE